MDTNGNHRGPRWTLMAIGTTQALLGATFLVAPSASAGLMGLQPAAPAWANWLLTMMAARFLGYAVGMFAAARAPQESLAWINTMIAIQVIDWVATIGYLAAGQLSLRHVTTAAFLPVVFVAALAWWHPRRAVGRRA
ncbi:MULTISPECIES: hypothetical protein [unclassified Micromonospora]|uniref:hypothetical protein n=1 Tax=unclassified Micromonospora TaxID=2617518 RepID=UPI003627A325